MSANPLAQSLNYSWNVKRWQGTVTAFVVECTYSTPVSLSLKLSLKKHTTVVVDGNCDFQILISQVLIYLPCHSIIPPPLPPQTPMRSYPPSTSQSLRNPPPVFSRWRLLPLLGWWRDISLRLRTAKLVLFVQIWINGWMFIEICLYIFRRWFNLSSPQ